MNAIEPAILNAISDESTSWYEPSTKVVSYKETIRNKVKVQGKFARQSGGRGQYGDVWIELEPLEPGTGVHSHYWL